MKNLIIVLFAFALGMNVFATQVKNGLIVDKYTKIANEYVDALNNVDGSFENGVSDWTNSASSTLSATTTNPTVGSYAGLITASSQLINIKKTVTLPSGLKGRLFKAGLDISSSISGIYVCALTDNNDTGCKIYDGSQPRVEVQFTVPNSGVVGIHIYTLSNVTGLVYLDALKIGKWELGNVTTIQQQSTELNITTGATYDGAYVLFPSFTSEIGSGLYTRSTVGSHHRFTYLRKAKVTGSFRASVDAGYISIVYKNGNAIQYSPVNGSSGWATVVPYSIDVNAGDYLEFGTVAGHFYGNETSLTMIATSISDNVVEAFSDGVDWTPWTPSFTGFDSVSSVNFWWKQVGSDILIRGSFVAGGTNASPPFSMTLPVGVLTSSTYIGVQSTGSVFKNTNGYVERYATVEANSNFVYLGRGDSNYQTKAPTTAWLSGDTISLGVTRIRIQNWSSVPTKILLPNSVENNFSAEIDSSGNITTKNTDWISSVVRNGSGWWDITLKSGLSSSVMVYTVSPIAQNTAAVVYLKTSNSVSVLTTNLGGTIGAYGFSIQAQKQNGDYTKPSAWLMNRNLNFVDEFNFEGYAGSASTNNRIAYWTTLIKSPVNNYISVFNNSTLGGAITANTNGVLNTCFYGGTNACYTGFSKNSTQLTTDFNSITRSDAPCGLNYSAGGNNTPVVCCTLKVIPNDVIRVHLQGSCSSATTYGGQFFGTFTKTE